jgi:hypothetical protein
MTIAVKSDSGGQSGSVQVNGTDSAFFRAGQAYPRSSSVADTATITLDPSTQGQVIRITTTAARTFGAPTNIVQDAMYTVILTTGGFTPSWNTAFKWPLGEQPSGLEAATYVFSFIGGAGNTLIPTGPGYKTGA